MLQKQVRVPMPSTLLVRICGTASLLSMLVYIGLSLLKRSLDIDMGQSFTRLMSAALIFAVALAIIDLVLLLRLPIIKIKRHSPKSIALNRWTNISLELSACSNRITKLRKTIQCEVFDHFPSTNAYRHLPQTTQIKPDIISHISYALLPYKRGELEFGHPHLRVWSPFSLWQLAFRAEESTKTKVFPDFSSVRDYMLFAMDNRTSQLGIKKKQRRGLGTDFRDLREFRRGDSIKQIDWKATARRNQLISREYQDERDQQITLLVDAGRRMSTIDGDLSHFDHSLNAMLLVSYIALRQGDSVSAMSFGADLRWVPPQKGAQATKKILHQMYDLYADDSGSDYIMAAENLIKRQSKRALVIIVTNSRDEDSHDLELATNLLRKKHVVLVANIREHSLEDIKKSNIANMESALEHLGLASYEVHRKEAKLRLSQKGILNVDCFAHELAVNVANSYLEIKRAGVL